MKQMIRPILSAAARCDDFVRLNVCRCFNFNISRHAQVGPTSLLQAATESINRAGSEVIPQLDGVLQSLKTNLADSTELIEPLALRGSLASLGDHQTVVAFDERST